MKEKRIRKVGRGLTRKPRIWQSPPGHKIDKVSAWFKVQQITANNRDIPFPSQWPAIPKSPNLKRLDLINLGITQPITTEYFEKTPLPYFRKFI